MNLNVEERAQFLIREARIQEAMEVVEEAIKMEPRVYEHRWVLFQILCIQRQWQRALKQLQISGELRPDLQAEIYTIRTLIQCEFLREKVFQAHAQPGYMFDSTSWMDLLLKAISFQQQGHLAQADALREEAFALIPIKAGSINGKSFEWLSDMDSRLASVIELFSVGTYRWCGLHELIALQFEPPKTLLDLIWRKVRCELIDSTIIHAYIPVRYPSCQEYPDNALTLLGRETHWHEKGNTLVQGIGQRIWMTEQAEHSILDCQELVIYREDVNEKTN